jgi:hypothetical protein
MSGDEWGCMSMVQERKHCSPVGLLRTRLHEANPWGTLLAVRGKTLASSRHAYLTASPCWTL